MDYSYLGYNENRQIVKGTIFAANEKVAGQMLSQKGYQVLRLQPVNHFVARWDQLFPSLFRVKPEAIIMFSRQLALLLESGIDIVTSLELLRAQASAGLKRVLGEVMSELRSGHRLSAALSKHPNIFPQIYVRSLGIGEQTGGLESVLKQIADYMEKELTTSKSVKGALRYPIIVSVVAFIVIAIMVTFVLPAFTSLYSSMGAQLPPLTKMLLSFVDGLHKYSLQLMGAILFIGIATFAYVKTPEGRFNRDKLILRLPIMGHISHLNELIRCCRSMSILFKAGLPLPEIMSLVIDSSNNRVIKQALSAVQKDMIEGQGLSRPMAKNPLFLPMMVQMVRVGEETGNLDVTLLSVAQNYEIEAEDKTRSLIGMIQPAMTLGIGIVVALIALSLISAMYSMYGQVV